MTDWHHGENHQTEAVSQRAEGSMRIEVVGDDTIDRQARTYAEYRVFSALTRCSDQVRRVRVRLRQVKLGSGYESTACTVTVALGSDSVRIRTRGSHAYAAINRAVAHIGASV